MKSNSLYPSPPWRTLPLLARVSLTLVSMLPLWAIAIALLTIVAAFVVALVVLVGIAYPFMHFGWGMQARLVPNTRAKAPWPDYKGGPIFEGDTIRHPTGEVGKVVFLRHRTDVADQWMVDYGNSNVDLARLILQIGHRGMAVVVKC